MSSPTYGFKRGVRSVTWPFGASTGESRIVAGADTPSELVFYGILQALLFYITDKTTGIELGYFFIGQTNKLDFGADQKDLVFGNVKYPVAGNPSSPTAANVKTNFQIELFDTEVPGFGFTIFKDSIVQFNTSVPDVLFQGNLVQWNGTSIARFTAATLVDLQQGAGFFVDSHDMPRGLMTRVEANTSTAAVSAETQVFVTAAVTFVAGRAYRVCWKHRMQQSAAIGTFSTRVRRNSLAGASLDFNQFGVQVASGGGWTLYGECVVKNATGANITDSLILTIATNAGTVQAQASADQIRFMEIWDCGNAASFPLAIQV